ncbi:4-carboxymuconolactone decarboxylase [Spirosoma sp. LMG 31447]|uniref:4-carboxymuconolactone decarboxylase n=2 Tax=Spirosoma utsteinense TaxID=2585773 RepID=A0ABR6W8W1_9BACT|nr:4-carboxymuconolactone decarboxylase [Spirosoma utsteinense]
MTDKRNLLNREGVQHTIHFSGLWLCRLLAVNLLLLVSAGHTFSQTKTQMVRIAKIVVDPAQLEPYKAALKEEIDASVRLEPGVLTLYAMSDKDNPTHITILEIYADTDAYKAHIQTPHFLKYKTGTKDMVKALELVETVPLIPGMKIK